MTKRTPATLDGWTCEGQLTIDEVLAMPTTDTWYVLTDCQHWTAVSVATDAGPPVRARSYVQCPLCWERTNVRAVCLVPTR